MRVEGLYLSDHDFSPGLPIVASLACLLSAFGIGALLTAGVRRWSRQWGFLDKPGGHKAHAAPVALGGGIAIMWSFVLIAVMGLAAMAPSDHVPGLGWLAAYKPGVFAKLPHCW